MTKPHIIADVPHDYWQYKMAAYPSPLPLPRWFKPQAPGKNFLGLPAPSSPNDADEKTISRILSVGALYLKSMGLSKRDAQWVRLGCDVCPREGFSLSSRPQLFAVNICAGYDFLDTSKPPIRADLVILPFVYDFKSEEWLNTGRKEPPSRWVSIYHEDRGAWRTAVERAQPKIVVVLSSLPHPNEVTAARLLGASFHTIKKDELSVMIRPGHGGPREPRTILREVLVR